MITGRIKWHITPPPPSFSFVKIPRPLRVNYIFLTSAKPLKLCLFRFTVFKPLKCVFNELYAFIISTKNIKSIYIKVEKTFSLQYNVAFFQCATIKLYKVSLQKPCINNKHTKIELRVCFRGGGGVYFMVPIKVDFFYLLQSLREKREDSE